MAMERDNFKILELLGEGVTSKVYKCASNEKLYAVKFVKKTKLSDCEKWLNSERIVQELLKDCPYICHLSRAFADARYIYYIYDYIRGSTLHELISQTASHAAQHATSANRSGGAGGGGEDVGSTVLPHSLIRLWICQLICVLRAMIENQVCHRDFKSENVMIDVGDVKVIDFNSAVRIGSTIESETTGPAHSCMGPEYVGTIAYWSPEMILSRYRSVPLEISREIAHAQDIWSVGCILYEMLTGTLPFHVACYEDIEYVIDQVDRFIKPNGGGSAQQAGFNFYYCKDEEMIDLCSRFLDADPRRRFNFIMNDPLGHPALANAPAYMPNIVDPFNIPRSILQTHHSENDLQSMELTPNAVGEVFAGRLLEDVDELYDDDRPCGGVPSVACSDSSAYYNSVGEKYLDLALRTPKEYGRRAENCQPPFYVQDWQRIQLEMNARDIRRTVGVGGERLEVPAVAESAPTAADAEKANNKSPSTRNTSSVDASPLATLSSEACVNRVIGKIQGLLRTLHGESAEDNICLWGAASITFNPIPRRSSVIDDSLGWCCATNNKASPEGDAKTLSIMGYAILTNRSSVIIVRELNPNHDTKCPPQMKVDATNRLQYLEVVLRNYAVETSSTVIRLTTWNWLINLDVGARANQALWEDTLRNTLK